MYYNPISEIHKILLIALIIDRGTLWLMPDPLLLTEHKAIFKKNLPTDPDFLGDVTGNRHIFF
jgi:hypothetical protein